LLTKKANGPYVGPDEWAKLAPSHEGSWWTAWLDFLIDHSGGAVAPAMGGLPKGAPLPDAPGEYVLQR
jgi:polyhydroxyalkanoate synthase subunit PhaC